jgi:hypothetical protein
MRVRWSRSSKLTRPRRRQQQQRQRLKPKVAAMSLWKEALAQQVLRTCHCLCRSLLVVTAV